MKMYSLNSVVANECNTAEALNIFDEIELVHEAYESLTDDVKSMESVSVMLDNLYFTEACLKECLFSEECYKVLDCSGEFSKLIGCSIDSIDSRVATEAIGEKIKETAKKFWEMLKNIMTKVKDFLKNLFTSVVEKAKKLKETNCSNVDFSKEVSVVSKEQWVKLEAAAKDLNTFASLYVSKVPMGISANVGIVNAAQELTKKHPDVLEYDNGTINIKSEALATEKKKLQERGWGSADAVKVCDFLIDNNDKTSRLGEVITRVNNGAQSVILRAANTTGVGVDRTAGPGLSNSDIKVAYQVITKAYVLLAKANRTAGSLVKTFTNAKKSEK